MTAAEPLLDAGYFPERVAWRPAYPHTPPIGHLLSVSHHISLAPDGWIDRARSTVEWGVDWRFNASERSLPA